MDPLDRQLADAVNVDPSPEFVARVRARISSEPTPARSRRWPLLVAASLAAATLAIAVSAPRVDRQTNSSAPSDAARIVVAPPETHAATAASGDHAAVRDQSVRVARRRRQMSVDVIVAADEVRGLREMANLLRDGGVTLIFTTDEEPGLVAFSPVTEIVVSPIEIAPLTLVWNTEGDTQ